MHELGLCEGIVAAVLRRASGRRVTALRVRVGGHVADADVLRQGIALAALGTPADGAAVDLVLDPLVATCRRCGAAAPVVDHTALLGCPVCGGLDIDVSGEEGTVLESITVDAGAGPDRDRLAGRAST